MFPFVIVLVKLALPKYSETELYVSARSDTRNYELILDTISFKLCDYGSSKANDDNTVIEGLMVLYSNVDCITTKMNEIKSVMSKRHEVSVFAFTEVKPNILAFGLTDTQIQVLDLSYSPICQSQMVEG